MAEGMNMCVFSGHITADARTKSVNSTTGSTEVARFTVAVNGRKEGETTFVQCNYWNPKGVLPYLTKGKLVAVAGSIRLASWEKDGQQRSAVELNVKNLTLLSGGKKEESPGDDVPF
jgi:single-strand DNA-binding protein